jgi:hypothetical protein
MGHCCHPICGWQPPRAAAQKLLLLLWLSKLLLLWLTRLQLVRLNRLQLLWLNRLQLLWLNSLLLLARGTGGCQLPDGEMTYGALASGTMDVNHLQFRSRRV